MIFISKDHSDNILQELWLECEDEENCDVVLIAANKDLRMAAHRNILSAASEFFKMMFKSKMRESAAKEIQLPAMSGDILKILIGFIYTGRVEILEDNVLELLKTAHMLLLTKVVGGCVEFLTKKLNPTNCFGFAFLADQYMCQTFLQNAKSYCLENFTEASQTEEFRKISAGQLCEMLASDDLCVKSEEDVFNSVMNWIRHDLTEREKHKAELLKLVRLPLLERSFLIENVKPICATSLECAQFYMEALESKLLPNCNINIRKNNRQMKKDSLLMAFTFKNYNMHIHYYCPLQSKWMNYFLKTEYHCDFEFRVMKNNLYIIGRNDENNKAHSLVRCLNLKTLTLSTTNPMICQRRSCRAAAFKGFLYVVGGQESRSVEKLNPETMAWTACASMSVSRCNFAIGVLNDKIYVAGGSSFKNGTLSSAEYYHPDKDVWAPISSMIECRSNCAAVVSNSLLYVIGGSLYDSKSVERYDPKTNRWTMLCRLNYGICNPFGCIQHCEKVLACCGSKIMEYDAENDNWVICAIPVPVKVNVSYVLFSYSDELLKSKFAVN